MAEQQQEQPQAAEAEPVKTTGDKSREDRESSFQKRHKQASKMGKLAPAADDQPITKPEPEPEKTEPVKTADDKPKSNEVDKRHAIAERREKRVAAKESRLNTRESEIEKRERDNESRFGDPTAAKAEYDKGSFHSAAKYIQRIFGDDFATITQKIARATAGLSPEKLKELEERDSFTREKREFEAQKEREKSERERGATREQAVKIVATKLGSHDVLKLRNGADLTLKELEASWDPERNGFTVTFKQAADKVLADKLSEAEALGLRRAQAKIEDKPATPPPPAKRETRRVVREVAKPKDGKRLTFEERHAAAGRLTARRRG